MSTPWSQVEYQIIIKTKGARTSLNFRVLGRALYLKDMSYDEIRLAESELSRWSKKMKAVKRRAYIRVNQHKWWFVFVKPFLGINKKKNNK